MYKNIEDKIIIACQTNNTMSLAAKEVNIPYSTFKRKAQQLGVWKPNRGAKGSSKIIKPLSDIFEGTRTMKSYNLKNRLISEGYKKSKCEECGISETWNGKFLTLELDHIDGNNRNNSLDNLKILCPNCHSQTPTFRGRKNKMHE